MLHKNNDFEQAHHKKQKKLKYQLDNKKQKTILASLQYLYMNYFKESMSQTSYFFMKYKKPSFKQLFAYVILKTKHNNKRT